MVGKKVGKHRKKCFYKVQTNLKNSRAMTQWLGCFKTMGDSHFYPSKVEQMSTRKSWN